MAKKICKALFKKDLKTGVARPRGFEPLTFASGGKGSLKKYI